MQCRICLSAGPFEHELVSQCQFNRERLVRYECPDCGVIFGTRRMLGLSPEALGEQYTELYSSGYQEGDPTEVELALLKQLSPHPDGAYLNWAAGHRSSTSERAQAKGINLVGYDPYVPTSKPLLLKDPSELGVYDGIMSANFLEHLQDPVSGLREMRRHLKPDGLMIHSTGCFQYICHETRFHLFFFTGTSVEVMAGRAGLIAQRTTDPDVILFRPRRQSPVRA